jgi:hypothetical protein
MYLPLLVSPASCTPYHPISPAVDRSLAVSSVIVAVPSYTSILSIAKTPIPWFLTLAPYLDTLLHAAIQPPHYDPFAHHLPLAGD